MCTLCVTFAVSNLWGRCSFYHELATVTIISFFHIYSEYRLVIVCDNEDQDKSQLVSRLQLYRRPYTGSLKCIDEFQHYLKTQFTIWPSFAHKEEQQRNVVASVVDIEK